MIKNIKSMHYKEAPPGRTIEHLKKILLKGGIVLNEEWYQESTAGTFSVRVTLPGTTIGTNGKGVSEDYALASAYAEFLERYQNRMLGLKNRDRFYKIGYYNVHDEKYMSIRDILSCKNAFMQYLFTRLKLGRYPENERIEKFSSLFRPRINESAETMVVYPFYNVNEDKEDYLPISIALPFYGSNGMSAGNTPCEALVQAFSEIFERYVQKEVISRQLSLPDVPKEYLKKYYFLYSVYSKINSIKGYRMLIKDCSFGGMYPVVAIVIINLNTGKYGIHFGSHPDFEIALERAFTEAAQGQDILDFSSNCEIDFYNKKIFNKSNYYNIYDVARGKYPHEFFSACTTLKFCACTRFLDNNNEDMLQKITNALIKDGYNILIRDCSTLGFPSYHVIIPGMSELTDYSELDAKIYNTRIRVRELLKNPLNINQENVRQIEFILRYFIEYYAYTSLESIFGLTCDSQVASGKIGIIYILMLCAIYRCDIKACLNYSGILLNNYSYEETDRFFIRAISDYYKGLDAGLSMDSVLRCIHIMYDEFIVKRVEELILNKTTLFERYIHVKELDDSQYLKFAEYLDRQELELNLHQLDLRRLFQCIDR